MEDEYKICHENKKKISNMGMEIYLIETWIDMEYEIWGSYFSANPRRTSTSFNKSCFLPMLLFVDDGTLLKRLRNGLSHIHIKYEIANPNVMAASNIVKKESELALQGVQGWDTSFLLSIFYEWRSSFTRKNVKICLQVFIFFLVKLDKISKKKNKKKAGFTPEPPPGLAFDISVAVVLAWRWD